MKDFLYGIGIWEVLLVECISFAALWAWDEYIAQLVTIILVPIFFSILVISLISEMLERSKVPKKFFYVIGLAAAVPLVIMALVHLLT